MKSLQQPTVVPILVTLTFAALASIAACLLSGCTVNVDKRSWTFNHVNNESRLGAASTTIDNATVNTSDTRTDAQQAIDGAMTIPFGLQK